MFLFILFFQCSFCDRCAKVFWNLELHYYSNLIATSTCLELKQMGRFLLKTLSSWAVGRKMLIQLEREHRFRVLICFLSHHISRLAGWYVASI
uniref:Uncharacterized protein n=1 Tax=Rhizophora mucronata TaxID=61149 RepID=A0A2P2M534_RHIMU